MSRDALASALWAEHSDEQAKNSLRQALAVLRKELKGQDGAFFAGLEGIVTLHPDRIAIDTDLFLRMSKLATRQSARSGRSACGAGHSSRMWRLLSPSSSNG